MKRALLAGSAAMALVSCNAPADDGADTGEAAIPDMAALDSDACRDVAQLYADAVAAGDYASASAAWDTSGPDPQALSLRFGTLARPRLVLDEPQPAREGALETCAVPATLTDAEASDGPPRRGVLTLARDPASAKWRIRSSDFAEDLPREGNGAPA